MVCFSDTCKALVDNAGKVLQGDELARATEALNIALREYRYVDVDRKGIYYGRKRFWFSRKEKICYDGNKPVQVCNHVLPGKNAHCPACGTMGENRVLTCGNCGYAVKSDARFCGTCGHDLNVENRKNMDGGNWKKQCHVFAERFEINDLLELMKNGFEIQESQCGLWLDGGRLMKVLPAGNYRKEQFVQYLENPHNSLSLVMVDNSDISIAFDIDEVRSKDNLASSVHLSFTMRFDSENAGEFLRNIHQHGIYTEYDKLVKINADSIADSIRSHVTDDIKRFCCNVSVEELFTDAELRIKLENEISRKITDFLARIGMKFVYLRICEFESEVFDELRKKAGEIEVRRREVEFMLRMEEINNNATRTQLTNAHELDELVASLAQKTAVSKALRDQELERIKINWEADKAKIEFENSQNLKDQAQKRTLERSLKEWEARREIKNAEFQDQLDRKLKGSKNAAEIEKIKIELLEKRSDAKIRQLNMRYEIYKRKKDDDVKREIELAGAKQKLKIELAQAFDKLGAASIIAVTDDPGVRESLLKFVEIQDMSQASQEVLLAAAAARGNVAAAEALKNMSSSSLKLIDAAKNEQKEMYEKFLKMNQEMFNQAVACLSKASTPPSPVIMGNGGRAVAVAASGDTKQ